MFVLPAQFIKPCTPNAVAHFTSDPATSISRNRLHVIKATRSDAKEAMRESIKRAVAAQAVMDAIRDSTDSDNDEQVGTYSTPIHTVMRLAVLLSMQKFNFLTNSRTCR